MSICFAKDSVRGLSKAMAIQVIQKSSLPSYGYTTVPKTKSILILPNTLSRNEAILKEREDAISMMLKKSGAETTNTSDQHTILLHAASGEFTFAR